MAPAYLACCSVESQGCWMCVCVEQRELTSVCSTGAAACLIFLSMCLWNGGTYYSQTRTHAEHSLTSPSSTQCPLPCPFMPISASLSAYSHYSMAVHLRRTQQNTSLSQICIVTCTITRISQYVLVFSLHFKQEKNRVCFPTRKSSSVSGLWSVRANICHHSCSV